jgi:triacylglycerol lipase
LPLAGATVEVFVTNDATGERISSAIHRQVVGSNGQWGPFRGENRTRYELVITAPGYAVTHIYRSAFPRSSSVVHLRAERLTAADQAFASVVILTRPRGYFGLPRDQISLDGRSPPPGIGAGTAGVSTTKLGFPKVPGHMLVAQFNGERVIGRAWPALNNEITFFELHY